MSYNSIALRAIKFAVSMLNKDPSASVLKFQFCDLRFRKE